MINEELIRRCQQQHRPSQRLLYERMAPALYHTCKRYLRHPHEIEEVLSESCFLMLTKIVQLKEVQAFEGWARRIAVNECLAFLKKQTSFSVFVEDTMVDTEADAAAGFPMDAGDLLKLLQELPDGCRTVFNLFAIEGYTHKEIAGLLGISEGTSKSQLNFSRKKLQELVHQFYDQSYKQHEQFK